MKKIKNIVIACRELLQSWKYWILLVSISFAFALFEVWLASYSIILFVYRSSIFSWHDRLSILWSAITIFFSQFPVGSQILAFSIALLVGLNFTLLIFYLKKRIDLHSAAGTSLAGTVISLLGVGCSSCGSVILSSVFGFAVTTKIIAFLPLRGKEFSFIAIAILLTSIYLTAQKIVNPAMCKIKNNA